MMFCTGLRRARRFAPPLAFSSLLEMARSLFFKCSFLDIRFRDLGSLESPQSAENEKGSEHMLVSGTSFS